MITIRRQPLKKTGQPIATEFQWDSATQRVSLLFAIAFLTVLIPVSTHPIQAAYAGEDKE
jgi:hypothetical protein